jgi:hypothetical protein
MKSLELAFYSHGRPNRAGRVLNGLWYWWAVLGLPPSFNQIPIEVPGRKSGVMRRAVVLVADYQRERYLVSMLGERSDWLRNIRANDMRAQLRRRRRRVPLAFVEVPVEDRAPIIKAWARRAKGGRHHLAISPSAPQSEYAAIAPRVPVLRMREAARETRT